LSGKAQWRLILQSRHFDFSFASSFGLGLAGSPKVNFSAGRDSFHVPFLNVDFGLPLEQPVSKSGNRRKRVSDFIISEGAKRSLLSRFC
jgi:hypothetical protein